MASESEPATCDQCGKPADECCVGEGCVVYFDCWKCGDGDALKQDESCAYCGRVKKDDAPW